MAFVIKYEEFDKFKNGISNNYTKRSTNLKSLKTEVKKLINSKDLDGKSAEALKLYLETIHLSIIKSINNMSRVLSCNCTLYRREYRSSIDSDKMAIIKSKELDDIYNKLKKTRAGIWEESLKLDIVLRDICGVYKCQKPKADTIIGDHDTIIKNINDLKTSINTYESYHTNNDFQEIESLINSTNALIEECKTKGRSFKANFNTDSLSSISSWTDYSEKSINMSDTVTKNKEIYVKAEESEKEIQEEIAAYKEREKHAKYVKWVVTGVCAVATVAVIAGTGGAATPLICGALEAGKGALTTFADKLCDEYVEKGNLKNVDWKEVVIDTGISGATGFVTGVISGKTAKFAGKVFKPMTDSTSLVTRIGGASLSKSSEDVLNGFVSRGTKTTLKQVDNLIEHGEFRANEIFEDVLDEKEIMKDASTGAINGMTGEIIDSASRTLHIDHYGLNNDSAAIRGTTGAIDGGLKGVIFGLEERYIEGRIDGFSHSEAMNEAMSDEKIISDVISSGAKGAADYTAGKKIVGKELTKDDLNDKITLDKIPKDKVSNPDNWMENSGKIYMDSKGKVTFESRKMKVRNNTSDKVFYGDDGKINYKRSTIQKEDKVIGGHFSYKDRPKPSSTY